MLTYLQRKTSNPAYNLGEKFTKLPELFNLKTNEIFLFCKNSVLTLSSLL